MAPVLGYYNFRGLAEPIRYLLHYLDIEFEDKRYDYGTESKCFQNERINNDMKNLELEKAGIPYYIDDDVKLTQSLDILRYLARKHQLYLPDIKNNDDVLRFENMEWHVRELYMIFSLVACNPKIAELKNIYSARMKDQIKLVENFIGDETWLFGDKISHVDFLLFETLDCLKMCNPNCCDEHPSLVKFLERFECLPGVEKYRKKLSAVQPLGYAGWDS